MQPITAPLKPQDPPKEPEEPKGSAKKPRLVVEKRASSAQARPGSVISYRITVRNVGDGPARKVRVCDHPPAGQRTLRTEPRADSKSKPCWTLPKLAADAERTFTLTAMVDMSSDGGTQRNTVTVVAANAKGVRRDTAGVRVKELPNTQCLIGGAGSYSLADIRFLC